jgi:hypothetical protein
MCSRGRLVSLRWWIADLVVELLFAALWSAERLLPQAVALHVLAAVLRRLHVAAIGTVVRKLRLRKRRVVLREPLFPTIFVSIHRHGEAACKMLWDNGLR